MQNLFAQTHDGLVHFPHQVSGNKIAKTMLIQEIKTWFALPVSDETAAAILNKLELFDLQLTPRIREQRPIMPLNNDFPGFRIDNAYAVPAMGHILMNLVKRVLVNYNARAVTRIKDKETKAIHGSKCPQDLFMQAVFGAGKAALKNKIAKGGTITYLEELKDHFYGHNVLGMVLNDREETMQLLPKGGAQVLLTLLIWLAEQYILLDITPLHTAQFAFATYMLEGCGGAFTMLSRHPEFKNADHDILNIKKKTLYKHTLYHGILAADKGISFARASEMKHDQLIGFYKQVTSRTNFRDGDIENIVRLIDQSEESLKSMGFDEAKSSHRYDAISPRKNLAVMPCAHSRREVKERSTAFVNAAIHFKFKSFVTVNYENNSLYISTPATTQFKELSYYWHSSEWKTLCWCEQEMCEFVHQ
jgi:hypothetical protein